MIVSQYCMTDNSSVGMGSSHGMHSGACILTLPHGVRIPRDVPARCSQCLLSVCVTKMLAIKQGWAML